MALTLQARIKIGNTVFERPQAVSISSTWRSPGDVCTILLPNLKGVLEKKYVKVGMAVTVELGYEEQGMRTEFTGYVRQINPNIPLEVICEDQLYLLRTTNYHADKTNVSVKDELAAMAKAAGVELAGDVPDLGKFSRLYLDRTGADMLDLFIKERGLVAYFRHGKLFVGARFAEQGLPTITLDTGVHIFTTNLEYRDETEAFKYRAVAKGFGGNGEYVERKGIGAKSGRLITLSYSGVTDPTQLANLAAEELKTLEYVGFYGTVTVPGYMYCEHGWDVNLIHAFYPERQGTYRVDEVSTSFDRGGFRRHIRLGIKVA
jgi:hypothetical protein